MKSNATCPCFSGSNYSVCCEPLLNGVKFAESPEQLMRSRYTAFCKADFDYLSQTWHPETVPVLDETEPGNWFSLEIIDSKISTDGTEGEVEFVAKRIEGDCLEVLHEVSDFVLLNGKWVYHSGDFENEGSGNTRVSMKSPCPCGSGERFKHCHYKQ